jgi:hypothetical protein
MAVEAAGQSGMSGGMIANAPHPMETKTDGSRFEKSMTPVRFFAFRPTSKFLRVGAGNREEATSFDT